MSKRKRRKMTPEPPYYWLLDNDGCYNCNCNHSGCRSCKRLKAQKAYEQKKRDKKAKSELKKFYY